MVIAYQTDIQCAYWWKRNQAWDVTGAGTKDSGEKSCKICPILAICIPLFSSLLMRPQEWRKGAINTTQIREAAFICDTLGRFLLPLAYSSSWELFQKIRVCRFHILVSSLSRPGSAMEAYVEKTPLALEAWAVSQLASATTQCSSAG